jgi:exosortase A-associated hydrolase 2
VVYVHPFAEELNKSRRMAALQARAMAAAGYAVLQIDLLGCGDSSGDLVDATWEAWLATCNSPAAGCSSEDCGAAVVVGSAHRLPAGQRGGQSHAGPVNLLFWQPVVSGKQFLQQFLRLRWPQS